MKRYNPYYDWKLIIRYFMLIVLMAALMKATSGSGVFIMALGMMFGLFLNRPIVLLFNLMLLICATVGNPNFFPKGTMFYLVMRVSLLLMGLAMTMRIAGGKSSPLTRPFLWLLPYIGWECLVSINGFCPPVSYLKLILFTFIYLAFYAIANEAALSSKADSRKVRSIVLVFAMFFIVGSVCLIPFPAISQMRWELIKNTTTSLYMGTAAHSQALGPIIATFNVVILADMLFSVKKFDSLYLILLVIVPILIWKTSSRTALGSYLAGNLMVAFCMTKARKISSTWKRKVINSFFGVGIILVGALFASGSVKESVTGFLAKRELDQGEKVTMDDVMKSRAGLVETAMHNFRKSPLFGNGFQVDETMITMRDLTLKEYLTAPVEKGVWFAAVLEEGGVVGFFIFSMFIFGTLFKLVGNRAYVAASTLFTFMVTNLGEFTFFSMSYTGGFGWAMVFMAVVMDAQRLREENRQEDSQRVARWGYWR